MSLRSSGQPVDQVPLSPERAHHERLRQRIIEAMANVVVNKGPREPMEVELDRMRAAQEASLAETAQLRAALEEIRQVIPNPRIPGVNNFYAPIANNFRRWGGEVDPNNFEIKTGLVNLIQSHQFGGQPDEDPNIHLTIFLDALEILKVGGVSDDYIRLKMFGFSLRDKAKEWYHTLDREAVRTWQGVAKMFLAKYFPPSKAQRLTAQIAEFTQEIDENISEAYERFRDMLRKCPQHGYAPEQQVAMFYKGSRAGSKDMMDASSGGSLLDRSAVDAFKIIEKIVENNSSWHSERATRVQPVKSITEFQMEEMAKEVASLKAFRDETIAAQQHSDGGVIEDANFVSNRNFNNGFQRGPNNLGYHPYNRNHPNFSWSNPANAANPNQVPNPPLMNVPPPPEQPRNTGEMDILNQILQGQYAAAASAQAAAASARATDAKVEAMAREHGNFMQSSNAQYTEFTKMMNMLETQVSQIMKGKASLRENVAVVRVYEDSKQFAKEKNSSGSTEEKRPLLNLASGEAPAYQGIFSGTSPRLEERPLLEEDQQEAPAPWPKFETRSFPRQLTHEQISWGHL